MSFLLFRSLLFLRHDLNVYDTKHVAV